MSKQSSVDWLISELYDYQMAYYGTTFIPKRLIEQAKAMHREEQGQTWDKSLDNLKARGMNEMRAYCDFDEYYNETYGGCNNDNY